MVTTKKRLSAFYPTDLELLLRNLGIRRVVLTGCMTDCCVINPAEQPPEAVPLLCRNRPHVEPRARPCGRCRL